MLFTCPQKKKKEIKYLVNQEKKTMIFWGVGMDWHFGSMGKNIVFYSSYIIFQDKCYKSGQIILYFTKINGFLIFFLFFFFKSHILLWCRDDMFCHIIAAAVFPISWHYPVWKHKVTIFIWALVCVIVYFCPVTGLQDQRLQCLSRQADKYAEYSFSCSIYWSFTHAFQTSPSSKARNGCPNRTFRQREINTSVDFTKVSVCGADDWCSNMTDFQICLEQLGASMKCFDYE